MWIITMKKAHGSGLDVSVSSHSTEYSIPNDWVVLRSDIHFLVSYSPFPVVGRLDFKVYCRQVGEDMRKIPGMPLFDIVIPQITDGSTKDHIASFLKKLIAVKTGQVYQYASHSLIAEDYVDINNWASMYTNYSRLENIHVNRLDSTIAAMKLALPLVETTPVTAQPPNLPSLHTIQSRNIQETLSPGVKNSSSGATPVTFHNFAAPGSLAYSAVFRDDLKLEATPYISFDFSKKRKELTDSAPVSEGVPSFKQKLVSSIPDGAAKSNPRYFDVLTSRVVNEVSTKVNFASVCTGQCPSFRVDTSTSVISSVNVAIPAMNVEGNGESSPKKSPTTTENRESSPVDDQRIPFGDLPIFNTSFDTYDFM